MSNMQAQQAQIDQEIEQKDIATPVKPTYRESFEKMLDESLDANQQYTHVVKRLLVSLSLPKTLQCFSKQSKTVKNTQNPELSSQKMMNPQDEGLDQIIMSEEEKQGNLEHILQNILEQLLPEDKRKLFQQHRESNRKLEQALQSIFSKKQKATIPIYKILDVQFDKRHIDLFEIDDKERLFLAEEKQNWIHLIDEKGKLTSRKIQNCKDSYIMNIRWTGQFLAVLMSTHKILLFTSELEQHKIIRLGKMHVTNFDVKIHPYPRKLAQTFARNRHGHISICKLYSGNQWEVIDKEIYEYGYPLNWDVFMVRSTTKESFTREQQQFTMVNQLWHFYTLDEKMQNVLKFDSVTKQVGTIWNKKGLIIRALHSSSCMKYILMVLATCRGVSDHYEYLKIDGHGIQIEKTDLSFIRTLEGRILKNIQFLQPDWLCCAQWRDTILYFSLKTGRLIYTHEILIQNSRDGRQELVYSGPSNCLLFIDNTHLRLLSTINRDKRHVRLEVSLIESRDEMVRRFSRLHGLPENLLLLLHTIRNNEP